MAVDGARRRRWPGSTEPAEDRFMKVREICDYLGISKSTFYKLVNDDESGLGDIAVRLPGVEGWRARLSRLRRWAEGGG